MCATLLSNQLTGNPTCHFPLPPAGSLRGRLRHLQPGRRLPKHGRAAVQAQRATLPPGHVHLWLRVRVRGHESSVARPRLVCQVTTGSGSGVFAWPEVVHLVPSSNRVRIRVRGQESSVVWPHLYLVTAGSGSGVQCCMA